MSKPSRELSAAPLSDVAVASIHKVSHLITFNIPGAYTVLSSLVTAPQNDRHAITYVLLRPSSVIFESVGLAHPLRRCSNMHWLGRNLEKEVGLQVAMSLYWPA